jgi:hypothetical protein
LFAASQGAAPSHFLAGFEAPVDESTRETRRCHSPGHRVCWLDGRQSEARDQNLQIQS